MPPESRDDKDILNQSNNPENTSQTDFPEIEEYFGDDESKKGSILNVLKNGNIGDVFKKILNSKKSENCLFALLECKNDETKIKEVILANLPEGYAYDVSTNEVVKTEEKKDNDYTGATIMDQKTEQAKTDTEQAKTDTEQAKTDTEQAKTDTEQARTDTEQARTDIEKTNQIMEEVKQYKDYLVNKYPELNKKVDENFQTVKKQLENNGTLNQLRQNHNEQFINDYILVQTTLQELKSNPTNYDQNDISYFDKIVKNLDNACNIPDTNLNSFSSKNITRTRHELFNSDIGNQDLINLKESNIKDKNSKMGTENSEYDEMFPEMSEKDLVATYGKFLHKAAKPYLDRYNQHLANGTIDQYRQTNEYKQFIQTINNIKLAFDNKTKDLVEELCIISQIKGMYMCMGEGADFQMNKANEIESKDGILTLNGHIDGIAFSIRQDTNDPEARLQTSTRFRKKDNAFVIGNHFEDSNFILPSQSEVFNLAVKSVNSDGALQEAETPADYVSKLQDKIMSKMDDMYEDTKYVNHYMHEQVKGEQVMDKSLALVKNIKKSEIPTPITESNKGLFDFVGLIHFNIENSTSLEKNKLDSCLTKIQTIVDEYKDKDKTPEPGKYPPIIEYYLTDKTILKNTKTLLEGGVVGGESMFDLFGKYRDKSDQRSDGKFGMINFTSLENDLIPGNQSHSLIAKEFVASQEKKLADYYLANNIITAFD